MRVRAANQGESGRGGEVETWRGLECGLGGFVAAAPCVLRAHANAPCAEPWPSWEAPVDAEAHNHTLMFTRAREYNGVRLKG